MAFPSHRKNKTDNSDEYSRQLISKPDKNNSTSPYGSCIDENNEAKNIPHRFKVSNLKIRSKDKTYQAKNLLSPDTASNYKRIANSQPVTPTKPFESIHKDDFKDLDAMVSSSVMKLERSTSNQTPTVTTSTHTFKIKTVPRPKTNTKKARPKSVQNPIHRSHTFVPKHKNSGMSGTSGRSTPPKPGIIHKNIVPQMWDENSTNSLKTSFPKQRSNSNSNLISYGKFIKKNKIFPATPGTGTTSLKYAYSTGSFSEMERVQTTREHNKKFILNRLQSQNQEASLFRRRSVVSSNKRSPNHTLDYDQKVSLNSHLSYSINEDVQYESYEMVTQKPMDYNQYQQLKGNNSTNTRPQTRRTTASTKTTNFSRQQLVYIGGINNINKCDVRDRLYDLFEIWGDRPQLQDVELWNADCIYVRFPSIAQAIDGINVFDGLQPNGYILTAELVLEGSQMVYIDGLDGDWTEEIFKNFVDINNDYKVSIKCNKGDKAYAFVQFSSLDAVQSAIDRFDGETEIDGKLVRWEHMVKAYIGKIGENTTTNDIQRELSEFDPSFKYLPVEIRKSREPIYYDHRQKSKTPNIIKKHKKRKRKQTNRSHKSRDSIHEEKSHILERNNNNNNKHSKSKQTTTLPHTPSLSTIESSRLVLNNESRPSQSNIMENANLLDRISVDVDIDANQLTNVAGTMLLTRWSDSLDDQITPVQTASGNEFQALKPTPVPSSVLFDENPWSKHQQSRSIHVPMLEETKMVSDEDLLMHTQNILEKTKLQKFGKKDKDTHNRSGSNLSSVNVTPVPSDSDEMDSNDSAKFSIENDSSDSSNQNQNQNENQISHLQVQMLDEPTSTTTITTTDSDSITDSDVTDLTENTIEFEWHYYAYIWFWSKSDAMRAQIRFDKRNCFGAILPVRVLLMNDMTQKVYVSGLMEGYTNRQTIEQDIEKYISETILSIGLQKCIITYRENGSRPFAYLRFPSQEITREAIELFDNKICFGNQNAIKYNNYNFNFGRNNERNVNRIHLEFVKDASDLLSHGVSRKWNRSLYWYLVFSFIFLPVTLTFQWIYILYYSNYKFNFVYNKIDKYNTTKELAPFDLLSAIFCFNDSFRLKLKTNKFIRLILIIFSYILYIIFYFLLYTMINIRMNDLDIVFTALLPILLYFVLIQLMSCWCSMSFEVAFPQFHVLEHVSMYFDNSILYSRIHIMASDFATSKGWNCIKYPSEYPIEYNNKIMILSIIYPLILRIPLLYNESSANSLWNITDYNGLDILIEIFSATLMFAFCFILFCAFNTITTRTLSYWKQVHGITELITLKNNIILKSQTQQHNFLRLDNENNLFAWLSLRSFIHRKGDVVFCGLEMQSLFLIIMVFVNLVTIMIFIIVIFDGNHNNNNNNLLTTLLNSGFILAQLYFLCVCLYYVSYILMIGFWFAKENEDQLNRVERQKLYLSTETMKQYLNYEKYKLCDNQKVNDMKLLLNSMDALVQHVETKEITPQLWGIKMNDFKWKIALTVIAAVIPSVAVRLMLNV